MDCTLIKLLLVEDDPVHVLLLQEYLAAVRTTPFQVTQRTRLSEALHCLSAECFDVVLLDLSLPDSMGWETFAAVQAQAPEIPIVVLTGLQDEALAVKLVQEGAQDYLIKGQLHGDLLTRALRYAMERHQILQQLRAMSLVDTLTHLYSWRGFWALAEQQMWFARRQQQGFVLFFVNLEEMQSIYDAFGRAVGDEALIEVAELLRETFRRSDIIARLGGNEFVVLANGASQANATMFTERLQKHVATRNAREREIYILSLDVSSVYYDPSSSCTLEELMEQADTSRYGLKRHQTEEGH